MTVGTQIRTATRTGPAIPQRAPGATYFVAGQTERGVTTPQKVTSLSDFERLYGARVTYGTLWDDLRTFFEEGGGAAYVRRVLGTTPTKGTLTLVDKAGTPLSTLRIDALSQGAWSTGLTVAVAAGTTSGTFKLTVAYSGTGNIGSEVYDNLVTPADAVNALTRSAYVRGTNLASATAAPNNQPATLAATALSAGTDDRGTIVTASYTAALADFNKSLGAGSVAIPGQAASAVGTALIAHAKDYRRIGIAAPAIASTVNQAVAEAAALRATSGSEHAGVFYPWIKVTDDAGGSRTISPEGFIAACRARAHETAGPWRAAAGDIGRATWVLEPETELTAAQGDSLNDAAVNAIRPVAGVLKNYGWRSLSTDTTNYAHLTGRDTLNDIVVAAEREFEQFVFAVIDGRGQLFADMAGVLTGIVAPIAAAGGLYARVEDGEEVDPGYRVDTGPGVNTVATIAANEAHAAAGVRISPVGELVIVDIAKASFTAGV